MTPYRLFWTRALNSLVLAAASAGLLAVPPAPLPARAGEQPECAGVSLASLPEAVEAADIVVLARVVNPRPEGPPALRPLVYFKGSADDADISLGEPRTASCAPAPLAEGERVVAFLRVRDGLPEWPPEGALFTLAGGAVVAPPADRGTPESELSRRLSSLTGQYAVPAPGGGQVQALVSALVPVGLVLGALLGIALVLMRTWHRIDPS